jgi:hypothetical protein
MEGPGANSEEKHEPASYIDTALVDSLKALDPEGPIREADIVGSGQRRRGLSAGSGSPSVCAARGGGSSAPKSSKAVLNVGLTLIRPIFASACLAVVSDVSHAFGRRFQVCRQTCRFPSSHVPNRRSGAMAGAANPLPGFRLCGICS